MNIRDRQAMVRRVRQLRRTAVGANSPSQRPVDRAANPSPDIAALENRLAHLEQLLEGFQDSVDREAQRQNKRLSELEARVDPTSLRVALGKDARERGL